MHAVDMAPGTLYSTPLGPVARAPARRIIGQWRHVRVSDVQVTGPTGQDQLAKVRARVELGALLPADVVVEVVPPAALAEQSPPSRPYPRLWSQYSYHNDSYAYEGSIPPRDLAMATGWVVRVMPAPDIDRTTVPPVVGWVPTLPAIADAPVGARLESGASAALPRARRGRRAKG